MFLLGFAACDIGPSRTLDSLQQPITVEIERLNAAATNPYLVLTAMDVSVENRDIAVKCPCYVGDYHHLGAKSMRMLVATIVSGDIKIGLDPDGEYEVSITRQNIFQKYYFSPALK